MRWEAWVLVVVFVGGLLSRTIEDTRSVTAAVRVVTTALTLVLIALTMRLGGAL